MTSLAASLPTVRMPRVIPVIFASFFFWACGAAGTNSPTSTSSSDASSSSTGGSSGSDASLSYTLDGQHFAYKNPMTVDGKTTAPLYINAVSNDPATGKVKVEITVSPTSEVFDFKVDNKGASYLLHYSPSLSATKYEATYMNRKYQNFYADSVTVTINQLTDSRVSGTFSGKFVDDNKKQTVQMTDGSFDIPVPPARKTN